jgi:DNA-binding NtrC family response regulator
MSQLQYASAANDQGGAMATALVGSSNPAAVALLVSPDENFRRHLRTSLSGVRWSVLEAVGGAEALMLMAEERPHAILLDSWLPDLHLEDFAQEVRENFPGVEMFAADGSVLSSAKDARTSRRGELLHALRSAENASLSRTEQPRRRGPELLRAIDQKHTERAAPTENDLPSPKSEQDASTHPAAGKTNASLSLPEFIGSHPAMLELGRRIELVAARKTPVLVQGPTGTGKELVARALHRLSDRAAKPFVALNCAAIPESLLEAELFGHARGAFTGAVQRRTGRIESAQGGTLFLDEIGEMPLSLQSKLLRFLENGELQRVGENEPVFVDVRIVAATHQPLARRAREGSFRSDLFYRLAVFLIATPSLAERSSDLPVLVEYFLQKTSGPNARKRICREALSMLQAHTWPGNIRELQHVIERACILSEDRAAITTSDIEFSEEV